MVNPIRKWLKEREKRKRSIERVARQLAKRGVPSSVARSLAKRVVDGDYTVNEAVQAYRAARSERVKRLTSELKTTRSKGFSLADIGDIAASVSNRLSASIGLDSFAPNPDVLVGPEDLLGSGRSRRRKKRR